MLQSIFLKMFGSLKQKMKINLKLSTYDRRLYTSITPTFLLDPKLNHVNKTRLELGIFFILILNSEKIM
jgi:hypothetical protein